MSSLTYPQKPDGSLNIFLGPRHLNKAVIQEYYRAATWMKLPIILSGTKVFSKVDVKDEFWSICLDTPSSYLTTFNTLKGCHQFLCMPFRLKMSQDVFQMWMDKITDSLPGIISIHDGICVYGKDITEHDNNLLQLMKIAQHQGLVFNSSKCSIHQSQISYYDTVFTVQDRRPDPAKVQALQDFPAPQNSKQLQSFLGLINYLQPFLPGLATKTTFIASNKLGLEPLH